MDMSAGRDDSLADGPLIRFKEGDVVTTVKRFVWEANPQRRSIVCYHCCRSARLEEEQFTRCSGCQWAYYCSKACQVNLRFA